MKRRAVNLPATEKAGWRVPEFAYAIGCCRATVYNLADRGEIEIVKVGGMSIIMTSPAAYLAAKAAQQRAAA
jgi:hypothetical protein